MKERAFHFRGPASVVDAMVRATLSGTKTQFRMPVKFNEKIIGLGNIEQWARKLAGNDCYGRIITEQDIQKKVEQLTGRIHPLIIEYGSMISLPPPYGQPGDRLWVREKFATHFIFDDLPPGHIAIKNHSDAFFYADGTITNPGCEDHKRGKWRLPIHMPRWASRITLDITSVRVEHLQDISDADAQAEGVQTETADPWFYHIPTERNVYDFADDTPRGSFRKLWESINDTAQTIINTAKVEIDFIRVTGQASAASSFLSGQGGNKQITNTPTGTKVVDKDPATGITSTVHRMR